MKEVNLAEVSQKIVEGFEKGVLLTVKNGDKVNTMTIGWGTVGRVWGKMVFTVMVRYSRFTHELISGADSFTLAFPAGDKYKDVLEFCGKNSGRDVDKAIKLGLKYQNIDEIESPLIDAEGIHAACKILYKEPMTPGNLAAEEDARWYDSKDYHVIYYGEVVKTFVK